MHRLADELVAEHRIVNPLLDQLLSLQRVGTAVVACDARVAAAQTCGNRAQLPWRKVSRLGLGRLESIMPISSPTATLSMIMPGEKAAPAAVGARQYCQRPDQSPRALP